MKIRALVVLLLSILFLVACGKDATGPSETPLLVASRVEVIGGGDQIDTVGQLLPAPIRVLVVDTSSPPAGSASRVDGDPTPVPGQLVNFVVTSGGGHVFAGVASTDSLGRAQELWTLGPTAGEQCLEARAVDPESGAPLTFAKICAEAVPGPVAATGFLVDSIVTTGGKVVTLPVFARDAFGNVLSVDAIAGIDSIVAEKSGDEWRATATTLGRSRLVLGGDTLALVAYAPAGAFTWSVAVGDTTWSVVGTYDATGVSNACAALGRPSAEIYRASAQWVVRTFGGIADTLAAGTAGTPVGGCADVADPRELSLWLPGWSWLELELVAVDEKGWHYAVVQPAWSSSKIEGTLDVVP